MAIVPENALDALLDELQTFSKPNEVQLAVKKIVESLTLIFIL